MACSYCGAATVGGLKRYEYGTIRDVNGVNVTFYLRDYSGGPWTIDTSQPLNFCTLYSMALVKNNTGNLVIDETYLVGTMGLPASQVQYDPKHPASAATGPIHHSQYDDDKPFFVNAHYGLFRFVRDDLSIHADYDQLMLQAPARCQVGMQLRWSDREFTDAAMKAIFPTWASVSGGETMLERLRNEDTYFQGLYVELDGEVDPINLDCAHAHDVRGPRMVYTYGGKDKIHLRRRKP